MTPRELCDLAAKINAAVPGLVKDYQPNAHGLVFYVGQEMRSLPDAAAMMLGRCIAWMEENMHDLMGPTRQTIVSAYRTLREYVATTLPGARA